MEIAPNEVAVFPLMNKEELTKKAEEIYQQLLDEDIKAVYDKSGSIGKRYAREDEKGTPYSITIDYETVEDGENKDKVTIRDAVSKEQVRISVEELPQTLYKLKKEKINFKDLK